MFVAPYEKLSRATWKSIKANGMCLSNRFTLRSLLTTVPPSDIDWVKLLFLMVNSRNPVRPKLNDTVGLTRPTVIQWNATIWSPSIVSVKDQVKKARENFLGYLRKGKGVFVFFHHHWDYFHEFRLIKRNMVRSFYEFLNFVSSKKGVYKATLSEVCLLSRRPMGR